MGSMIIRSAATIIVECLRLLRGVRRTCLGRTMTDTVTVASAELQSTQESQASMRDPFSFKAWSTGTERIEKTLAEIVQVAADCTFQARSVSAEPSGQQ